MSNKNKNKQNKAKEQQQKTPPSAHVSPDISKQVICIWVLLVSSQHTLN